MKSAHSRAILAQRDSLHFNRQPTLHEFHHKGFRLHTGTRIHQMEFQIQKIACGEVDSLLRFVFHDSILPIWV
ncbi:hypothetical protein CSQ96_15900 [Janthinobacterium sp. BJB412]|nr:hypothetical protein CSQ96_15900 [Janthinobacterium sp. BJB412]